MGISRDDDEHVAFRNRNAFVVDYMRRLAMDYIYNFHAVMLVQYADIFRDGVRCVYINFFVFPEKVIPVENRDRIIHFVILNYPF